MKLTRDKKRELVFILIGMLIFGIFATAPFLVTIFSLSPGMRFAPVHDLNHQFSDAYYHSAFVNRIINSGITATGSPTASELAGFAHMENFRFAPLWVAAFPGLFTNNMKFVYLFDCFISGCLYFLFPFLIARKLRQNRWASLFCSVVVFLYTTSWWGEISFHPLVFQGSNLSVLKKYIMTFFNAPFNRFQDIYALPTVSQSLRYMHLSISGLILLAFFLSLICFLSKQSKISLGFIFVLLIFNAYSYPSHMVISFGVAGVSSLYTFFIRDKKTALHLLAVTLAAGVFLLITGYLPKLFDTMNSTVLMTRILGTSGLVFTSSSIVRVIFGVLTNKYMLTGIIMLFLINKFILDLNKTLVPFIIFGCCLSFLFMFKISDIINRFFSRGIDQIWLLTISVVITALINTIKEKLSVSNVDIRKTAAKVIVGMESVCLAIAICVPSYGMYKYTNAVADSEVFAIDASLDDALIWLDANAENMDTVAAVDWKDITLIPVYTRASVFAGHVVIDERTPEDELLRYAAMWKALGLPREDLLSRFEISVAATHELRTTSPSSKTNNPPFVDEYSSNAAHLIYGLTYWPYITEVDGITIATSDYKTTPALNDYFVNVYDTVNLEMFFNQVEFVMLSGEFLDLPHSVPESFVLAYENDTHKIYRRSE